MIVEQLGVLRNVEDSDIDMVLNWRNHPSIRGMMYTKQEISQSEHLEWWRGQKAKTDTINYIYTYRDSMDGFVSLTQINATEKSASWAFYARPGAPRGTGSRMEYLLLDKAFLDLGLNCLRCQVLRKNDRVKSLHEKFGFIVQRPESGSSDYNNNEPIFRLCMKQADWISSREDQLKALVEKAKRWA